MSNKVRVLVAGVAALVLVGSDVPNMSVTSSTTAFAGATLADLNDVEEVKTLFNRDAGKVRLVLLVSPT